MTGKYSDIIRIKYCFIMVQIFFMHKGNYC